MACNYPEHQMLFTPEFDRQLAIAVAARDLLTTRLVSAMVMPVPKFNPDPQASMLHHKRSDAPSVESETTAPQNPHDFVQQHFDTEAHRQFMRGLG